MNKIIRFYNQNRKRIWRAMIFILFIISLIQALNYLTKVNLNKNSKNIRNESEESNITYNEVNIESEESILSKDSLSQSQKDNIFVIDEFFKCCNENNVNAAYELISQSCKEQMFPNIETFIELYHGKMFEKDKKNIFVENWVDNIYKVKIEEDILANGGKGDTESFQDYVTVIREDGKNKLNINNYIGKKSYIDEKEEKNNIIMQLVEKNTYMDYDIYTIKVTNNSDKIILLDELEGISSMYIEDEKEIKYYAYANELTQTTLLINPRETRTIKIRYYSKFTYQKEIKKLVFAEVILDYEKYMSDKNNENNGIEKIEYTLNF